MIRVIILGYGNVGYHLSKAIRSTPEIELLQVYNRHLSEDQLNDKLFTSELDELKEADVYIMAVSDDGIEALSDKLPFEDRLVVHTSGGVLMENLNSRNRRGVFYPLQTFTRERPVDFSEIPICIEAENETDLELLESLGNALSKNVRHIDSAQRKQLHMAAVFVNNFVNHLYVTASEILKEQQIDFDLLRPLIKETAAKLDQLTPFDAQTGPAKRNDNRTIKKHLHLLQDEQQKELYQLFTEAILKTHGKKL